MLLSEFINKPSPHQQTAYKIVKRGQRQANPPKELGRGNFGTAISQPHEVNSVLKLGRFSHDNAETDGYYQFINRVRHMDNPYFPQIDEVKTLKGGKMFKVRMERLTDLSHLSREELFALLERTLGYEPTLKITNGMSDEDIDDEILFWMTINFGKMLMGRSPIPDTADDNFKQAMQFMQAMHKEGYGEDIHAGNMMVRRSKYGSQLVFIDPFTQLFTKGNPEQQSGS